MVAFLLRAVGGKPESISWLTSRRRLSLRLFHDNSKRGSDPSHASILYKHDSLMTSLGEAQIGILGALEAVGCELCTCTCHCCTYVGPPAPPEASAAGQPYTRLLMQWSTPGSFPSSPARSISADLQGRVGEEGGRRRPLAVQENNNFGG